MVSKEQEEQIIKETRQIVKVFLLTKASDVELAKKFNISSSTIGRRLTNEARILKAFPDNGEKVYDVVKRLRKANSAAGKILGAETSKMMHGSDDVKQKLNLSALAREEGKQYGMLRHIILTFRPKLSLVSELFQIDENELYDNLIKYCSQNKDVFDYVFEIESTNQEASRQNILAFYQDFVTAKNSKDIEKYKSTIALIDDSAFKNFRDNHGYHKRMTDDEIMTVMKYQIKYCIGQHVACYTMNISRIEYRDRLKKILEENPELAMQYEQLTTYMQGRNPVSR